MWGESALEKNTEYIGKVALHYECYSGTDLYRDGSEEELLEIVRNYKAEEYNRVIEERKSWPVLYHLSDVRGNIADWIPFTREDRILEIGSGCGAVTGTLAKKAGRVDCIELSRARSLINAERHKAFDNIDIRVGNFQDIEGTLTEKYDYITLIGVLEYAASYIDSEHPYEEFLKIIKGHLKDGGKIIIAIENKYGLKYWAGCKEDHLGTYYSGIEGYVGVDSVRTFSKKGLEQLLGDCGMTDITFYYPYPDYKLPLEIYSDARLPKAGSLTNNFRNFDNERMIVFDEAKVYDNLIADGMFDIFSNSFLVIAG